MTKSFDAGVKLALRRAKDDPKMVPAKDTPIDARVMGGMLGTGMILGQVPLLRGYGAGRGTYYHATTPEAAASIAQTGIQPSYAGIGRRAAGADYGRALEEGIANNPHAMAQMSPAMKAEMREGLQEIGAAASKGGKKARINRYLMGESLNRVLEGAGVRMSHAQMAGNLEEFHQLMDQGMAAQQAARKVSDKVLHQAVTSGAMTPAKAEKAGKRLMGELPQFGLRTYFGAHPSQVLQWASGKGEGEMALEKMTRSMGRGQVRTNVESALDAASGGMISNVRDLKARMKYKPHSVSRVTSKQMQKELAELAQSGRKSGIIFGVSAPTGRMGYMQDFPVVKHLVNLNPGIKPSMRQFLETYEPGRDLSLPHGVPATHIQHVDIVDHGTGKIKRLAVTDAKKAVRSKWGQRAKKLILPVGLTALGGALLYRAIKPKQRMVPEGDPHAKQASVASDVGQVAKYVVPVGVIGSGLGLGAHTVARKLLPRKPVEKGDVAGQALEMGKAQTRIMGSQFGAMGAGATAGALAALLARKRLGPLKDMTAKQVAGIGAGIGAMVPAMFAGSAISGSETGMSPEMDPVAGVLPEGARNTIRRNPWMLGAGYGALSTAMPVAAAYTLRKYYPGTFSKAVEGIKKMKQVK